MDNKSKYLLRIDEELKLYIAREARLNNRSLNQEIIFRLRTSKAKDGVMSSITDTVKKSKNLTTVDTEYD